MPIRRLFTSLFLGLLCSVLGWGLASTASAQLAQRVSAKPPSGYPITKLTTAFIQIEIPYPPPSDPGYGYLRGYIVY